MTKPSQAQQYVLNRMNEGCILFSSCTHDPNAQPGTSYAEPYEYNPKLVHEGTYRLKIENVPITTLNAMKKAGLIREKERTNLHCISWRVDYELVPQQEVTEGSKSKLTQTQQMVLTCMKAGRDLSSYRDTVGEWGGMVSMGTIRALLRKGYIVAGPEEKNGPILVTHYKIAE
jgi:hypothetical protein